MMIKKLSLVVLLAVIVSLSGTAAVNAETTNTSTMTQIEALLKLIGELQAKLKDAQGQVDDLIKAGLAEGMTDEAIKEVQQLLATDPEIYPSGLTTGYFGPMTREAIKRFQTKFGLEVTGTLNEETRQALSEVRKERRAAGTPPGLLRLPEVRERIKERLMQKWENCDYIRPGKEAFCKAKKDKQDKDEADDGEMEDEEDEAMDDDDIDEEDQEITRSDAREAVVNAHKALNQLRSDIDEMEDGDENADVIDESKDLLKEAQVEMTKARRALAKNNYAVAVESAEEVQAIISGDGDKS